MLATFPETVEYMAEVITPAMGKLLGIENYTCAGCHPSEAPKKKKRAAAPARKSPKKKR